jgi:K+-transporting ATPase ATPase C chain
MKSFLTELKTATLVSLVFTVLLGGVYPLVVWAGAQALFAEEANGSLLTDGTGSVRGSRLLAQNFSSAKYFQPRPSAAGTGYDAASSSGSNLGPTSQKLADAIRSNVAAYRSANRLAADAAVPADAVTTSGSGLDPHLSLANARIQTARVALARGLPVTQVQGLVDRTARSRQWGIFGEPSVNVLELNRALDAAKP